MAEQPVSEQPKQVTAAASNNSTASDDTTVGEEVAPQDPMAITNFRSVLVHLPPFRDALSCQLCAMQTIIVQHQQEGCDLAVL